jgi:DNA topoisomerase-1
MDNPIKSNVLKRTGLVYVTDKLPGIKRQRRGRGFSYRLPNGDLVSDPEIRQRIKTLGIPPAYHDVWICPLDNGHLQATGYDDRGRKQYRYHDEWRIWRDQRKFHELVSFGYALPTLRKKARDDAERVDGGERSTLGALVLLLDAAHLRVGNTCYLQTNGTYGATTLLKKHVSFGETLELGFVAKGGRKVRHKLRAPRLQGILERIADLPGGQLFVWQDEFGTVHPVDSGSLNRYLTDISDLGITAKTFRTWGGTVAAFEHAARSVAGYENPTIRGMAEAAAGELANTPAVCRKSYIHPQVLRIAEDDTLRDRLRRALSKPIRPKDRLRVTEQRLLHFLEHGAH